mmetsp:Transcript_34745/g.83987  ORF Transcript_34745/g.83987 Transcript_34745/m.83987 type:complete len:120 (-) Transcript_34745:144-503(-)
MALSVTPGFFFLCLTIAAGAPFMAPGDDHSPLSDEKRKVALFMVVGGFIAFVHFGYRAFVARHEADSTRDNEATKASTGILRSLAGREDEAGIALRKMFVKSQGIGVGFAARAKSSIHV